MDGLSAATTVVSVIETAWKVINYVKSVKGAREARQKLILELVRATGLLSTLNDIVKDVGDEEWSQTLQSLDGPNGPLNAFKVLLEEIMEEVGMKSGSVQVQAQALQVHDHNTQVPVSIRSKMRNRIDHAAMDLKWPFTESTVQELLTKLERIKTYFLLALSSDNVRLSKLIRTELQTVHSEISVVKDNTTAILEHQEGAKQWTNEQKLIFQSISTLELFSQNSREELDRLKRGAGWLLSHTDFRRWRTGSGDSTLLLTGAPGSGKTSISRVVENFLQASGTSSEVFVVGIYFDFRNRPEVQTLRAMLAFIVARMFEIRPQLQKYYNKLMLTGEDPLRVEDSLRIIHRARQDFQHFYIVLDALDECDQPLAHEVIERLARLHTPLSMFVTMRDIPLATHFSNVVRISISDQSISDDIRLYVRADLHEHPPRFIDPSDEKYAGELDRITDTVVTRSDGSFRLAKLLLESLRHALTKRKFCQILERPPPSLEETYARRLDKLTNQNEADATLGKRVLNEVLSADHSMSAEELLDAVASDADWEVGDRGHVAERVDRCVECCMYFVGCDENGMVRMPHLTVEQFLRARGFPVQGGDAG